MTERFLRYGGMARAAVGVLALCAAAPAAEWPTYRCDVGRSAFTPERLAHTLHRQWTHVSPHAPRPAWPDPVREVHQMPFDYAYQPVAAGGSVYFGSSADHCLYAMELATGRMRWRFFTDAPVRFAPTAAGGKLYAASDDGCVYCLAADTGELIWRFRAGDDERLLGNESMISRRPLRSGLVVDGGKVYFTAGMWPSEGVTFYVLKAADGSVLTAEPAPLKFAPQGYLAGNETLLLAPTGRSRIWAIDRAAGVAKASKGVSQAILRGQLLLTGPGAHKANENLPVDGGGPFAERRRQIVGWDVQTGKRRFTVDGKEHAAVSDEEIFLAGPGKIAALEPTKMRTIWEIDHRRTFSLAVAGATVVVGGEDEVSLLSAADGREVWSAKVDGEARGLAVADGRLIVSTHKGRIVCFGPTKPANAPATDPAAASTAKSPPDRAALAGRVLRQSGVADGFCLIAGVGDGSFAMALAKRSNLRIYCADPDEKKVAAARKLLAGAGLYGTRVTVHHIDTRTLPYPDYFADLLVVDEPSAGPLHYLIEQLPRVLRPCGGTAILAAGDGSKLRLAGEGLTETRLDAKTLKVVRGPLAGAGEWNHQYANASKSGSSEDRLVRWPLRLLWFGKPGPGPMMNRHWRGTAPLCVGGRMFILGQHSAMAVDAYNGRELWKRSMPSIARRVVDIRGGSMAADADSIFLATSDVCLRLDAATGEDRQTYRLPIARPRFAISPSRTIEMGERGTVVLRNTPDALELELTTVDASVLCADPANAPTRGDSWELFFDFRPAAERNGLYGGGAFHAIIVPATAQRPTPSWRSGTWSTAPAAKVTGPPRDGGSKTAVRIAWADVRKLLAARAPVDFHFGAILNSSDDGKTVVERTHRFANDASYRLANCWAHIVVDPATAAVTAGGQAGLLTPEDAEALTWGNLTVSGETILGTIVAARDTAPVLARARDFSSEGHDYTGPPVAKVLDNVGLEGQARHIFALGKDGGRLRWTYAATGVVPHNGLAVYKGRVYLLDKPRPAEADKTQRRGEPAHAPTVLEVLDLSTGKRLWRQAEGLDDHVALRIGNGVLLGAHLKGLTAYDAETGRKLWAVAMKQPMHHCSAHMRVPVIAGEWVFDEPHAYDLRTGEARLDEQGAPWRWGGFRGCGTVSAARGMLLFRTGAPAMLDIAGGTGRHELPGIRPGCYVNMIAAGGLVLMPEASSGCGCPYNFQTTVVLAPAAKVSKGHDRP